MAATANADRDNDTLNSAARIIEQARTAQARISYAADKKASNREQGSAGARPWVTNRPAAP
jgi:hypothetical protein